MVNLRCKVVRLWVLRALQRNIMSRNGLSIEKYPHGRVDREHDDKPLECWVPQFQANLYECSPKTCLFAGFWDHPLQRKKLWVELWVWTKKKRNISIYIYIHIRMKYGWNTKVCKWFQLHLETSESTKFLFTIVWYHSHGWKSERPLLPCSSCRRSIPSPLEVLGMILSHAVDGPAKFCTTNFGCLKP